MFYYSLDLQDLHENTILLKITRNKLFKINKFYLLYMWNEESSELRLFINELNQDKATKELDEFVDLLKYLFNIDISITSSMYLYPIDSLPSYEVIEADKAQNNNIKRINYVVNELEIKRTNEEYRIMTQSIRYYSRSLKLIELELWEESFLTAFKPIELISNYIYKKEYQIDFNNRINDVVPKILKNHFGEIYRDENKDKEISQSVINTLEELLTLRRKISKTLGFLKLDRIKDEIGQVVRLRNKVGAHSNSGKLKLNIDDALKCQRISKEITSRFFFGDKFLKTNLNCERKI